MGRKKSTWIKIPKMVRRAVVVGVITTAVVLALYIVVVNSNHALVTMSMISTYQLEQPTVAIDVTPQSLGMATNDHLRLQWSSVGLQERLRTSHHLVLSSRPPSVHTTGLDKKVSSKPARYIIYRCLKDQTCGGYADRQKGIVAGYIMSVMTGRDFGIEIDKPCELSNFLRPNEVDWTVNPEIHRLKSQKLNKLDGLANSLRKDLVTADVSKIFTENITYFTVNIEFARYLKKNTIHRESLGWMANASLSEIYVKSWRTLFRLKDALQKDLDKFLSLVPKHYSLICAQIRIGANPNIPDDTETRNTPESVKAIWEFLEQYNDSSKYKIFVSTDSGDIRNQSLRLFPNNSLTLPGVIAHVDKSPECGGFRKVILDQEVLSHCDTLLITNSGVGRIAALFRQREDNLYCFMNQKLTKCNYTSPQFMPKMW